MVEICASMITLYRPIWSIRKKFKNLIVSGYQTKIDKLEKRFNRYYNLRLSKYFLKDYLLFFIDF